VLDTSHKWNTWSNRSKIIASFYCDITRSVFGYVPDIETLWMQKILTFIIWIGIQGLFGNVKIDKDKFDDTTVNRKRIDNAMINRKKDESANNSLQNSKQKTKDWTAKQLTCRINPDVPEWEAICDIHHNPDLDSGSSIDG